MDDGHHTDNNADRLKDYFSSHASTYAAFRPAYPPPLYAFILKRTNQRISAWDCATGNGQVARDLAAYFESVYATDISSAQLAHAPKVSNIVYAVAPAERTFLPDASFDLITVAQALHWLDITKFYHEVRRVARPGAVIAIWGYTLPQISAAIDDVVRTYYHDVVGAWWDPARKHVDEEYQNIHFPFDTVENERFFIDLSWSLYELVGYITSWSATQKYMHATKQNPIPALTEQLGKLVGDHSKMPVRFPVFLKLGRVSKQRQ